MQFDFRADDDSDASDDDGGFRGLTATRATQLIENLPLTIKSLEIRNANCGSETG